MLATRAHGSVPSAKRKLEHTQGCWRVLAAWRMSVPLPLAMRTRAGTNSRSNTPVSLLATSSRGSVSAVSSASSKLSSERCLKLRSPVASAPLASDAPSSSASRIHSYIAWPMPMPTLARPGVHATPMTRFLGARPGPSGPAATSACRSKPLIALSDSTGTPAMSSAWWPPAWLFWALDMRNLPAGCWPARSMLGRAGRRGPSSPQIPGSATMAIGQSGAPAARLTS